MANIMAGDVTLVPKGEDTMSLPRAAGGCPHHGRQWLRQATRRQEVSGVGEANVRVWLCTHGTAAEPRICGIVKEEEIR